MTERPPVGFIKITSKNEAGDSNQNPPKKERDVGFRPNAAQERIEGREFKPKDPKIWDLLYFETQRQTFIKYREMMLKAKDTKEYADLREKWQDKKEVIEKLGEKLPGHRFDLEHPDSYLEINASEKKVLAKINELKEELRAKGITGEDLVAAENSIYDELDAEDAGEVVVPLSHGRVVVPPIPTETPPEAPQSAPPPLPGRIVTESARPEPSRVETASPAKPDAWMGTFDAWMGGKAPEGPEGVEQIRRYVERVANSQGKNTLAYAYAESLLKDAQERSARNQAEGNRQGVVALQGENRRSGEELARVKGTEIGVFAGPTDARQSQLEREIREKQAELDALRRQAALGPGFRRGVENAYTEASRTVNRDLRVGNTTNLAEQPKTGGWFKKFGRFLLERAKGFATFGWWEIHQAGKFRRGTKEAAQEAEIQSNLLETESREFPVSAEQIRYNQIVENKIVEQALQKLEDNLKNKSWVKEYQAAHGGVVITPEKMALVERRLRERISQLRAGQVNKDNVRFAKIIRQSLDKKWWLRYVYGGVEAAAWAGAFWKFVWPKIAGESAGGLGPVGPGAEQLPNVPEGLINNPWSDTENVIENFLTDHGMNWDEAIDKLNLRDIHGDPITSKDQLIQLYDHWVAEDSNIAVPEWGLEGDNLATELQEGHPLNYRRVINSLLKLNE